MKSSRFIALGLGLVIAQLSQKVNAQFKPESGLKGYGTPNYDPECAYGCGGSVTPYIYCSADEVTAATEEATAEDGSAEPALTINGTDGQTLTATKTPTPACQAKNLPFLQSVAYCMNTYCNMRKVKVSEIQTYWDSYYFIYTEDNSVKPFMTYEETLATVINNPPTKVINATEPIDSAVLVDIDTYTPWYQAYKSYGGNEKHHSLYAILLVALCIGVPIVIANFMRVLPASARGAVYKSSLYNHFVQAPLYYDANKNKTSWLTFLLGECSRGQAFFLLYIVAVNVILSSVGYFHLSPNAFYEMTSTEITRHIADRTGVLSYANIPLVVLFAGRNNVLLWLTDWKYSTYLKFHKMAAVMCALQACLHSAMWMQMELAYGKAEFDESSREPYWIMGIVATLAMTILMTLSFRRLREISYEVFLIGHIVLAILAIVGTWYHIILCFGYSYGYQTWTPIAVAIWSFDRVARLARIVLHGWKKAEVVKIDEDYLMVTIDNSRCGGNSNVYFPTLQKLQPWLNHPFSSVHVRQAPKVVLEKDHQSISEAESPIDEKNGSIEKQSGEDLAPSSLMFNDKASASVDNKTIVFLRVHRGTTRKLRRRLDRHEADNGSNGAPLRLSCLLEGGYGNRSLGLERHDELWHQITLQAKAFPHVVAYIGGVGITAVLPALLEANAAGYPVRVYWTCRSAPLVHTIRQMITDDFRLRRRSDDQKESVEFFCNVGQRFDLKELVCQEVNADHQAGNKGIQVLLSGPRSLTLEARGVIAQQVKREGAQVWVHEESFAF